MRSLSGLVLLSGLGVGLFVYLPAPVDRDTSLEHVSRVAAERAAQPAPAKKVVATQRSFSPGISLASIERESVSAAKARPAAARVQGAPLSGWQTALAATGASLQTQTRALEPTSPKSRYKLIVDLQRKLKTKGCYYGRIDGSWGPGSKRAMHSFMQRVNAALPVEDPNYVLLSLLKSNAGASCRGCPADQVLSGGRCVPQPITAQTRHTTQPHVATTTSRETLPWQTGTATAATTNTQQAATQPLFKPLPTSVVSTEPLPGRMSIGAPKTLPPVNSVYSQPSTGMNAGDSGAAAYSPNDVAELPPTFEAEEAKPKKRKYKRSRRRGPGTPRYNLMLSLGGVY